MKAIAHLRQSQVHTQYHIPGWTSLSELGRYLDYGLETLGHRAFVPSVILHKILEKPGLAEFFYDTPKDGRTGTGDLYVRVPPGFMAIYSCNSSLGHEKFKEVAIKAISQRDPGIPDDPHLQPGSASRINHMPNDRQKDMSRLAAWRDEQQRVRQESERPKTPGSRESVRCDSEERSLASDVYQQQVKDALTNELFTLSLKNGRNVYENACLLVPEQAVR